MKRISPLEPQETTRGKLLDLPLPAPAGTMLPTLRKELPSKPVAAFNLVCSLPPLPLCGAVSDKTHVSFRTKCAAAAKRSKEHTKSSEVHAPPYRSRKVSFSPAVRGSRAQPLRSLGVAQGWFSFAKRTTLAINAARRAAKQRQPLRKTPPSAQNFQKILPLLHKSGRQTPPCAPFSEALRKKRSRKGEPCRKTKRAPPRAAHP